MSHFNQFVSKMLADRQLDEEDVSQVRQMLYQDGRLNLDDVRSLIELYCSADRRSPAFDNLFFSVLEQVLLEDGEVQLSEQFYLLKMLYSDRQVNDTERYFLRRLQNKAARSTPEFERLCETAFNSPSTNWDVGGR